MLRMPLRDPWPLGKHESRPCPVCGESWIPWPGSRLPCHGRCLLTDEGIELVHNAWKTDPTASAQVIADRFQIPRAVVLTTLRRLGVSVGR